MPHNQTSDTKKAEADTDVVARLFVPGPRKPRDVVDITGGYPWLSVGKIYRVRDSRSGRGLAVGWLSGAQTPILLTNNTADVSTFLFRQFQGTYPGMSRLAPAASQLVAAATIGTRAEIATVEFWEHERERVDGWLRGRENDPARLRALCTGVSGSERKDEWSIQFNVINTGGGVDSVTASGTIAPFAVRSIDVREVRPEGEFYYPLE